MLLAAASLGAASCADSIVDAGMEPHPASPASPAAPRAFVSTISGVIATANVEIPGSNASGHGAAGWTEELVFPRSGFYEVRTTGETRFDVNPAASQTGCGFYCVGIDVNAGAHYGSGVVGGAGLSDGSLRTYIAVTAGETPQDWEWGQSAYVTGEGQLTAIVAAGTRLHLFTRRTGIPGVRSCTPDVDCETGKSPGPTGWFLLNSTEKVVAREITPLQVEPNKTTATLGEVLTWTTVRYPAVDSTLGWTWVPEGGGATVAVPCTGQSCSYAPPATGRMKISGKIHAGELVDVEAYSSLVTVNPVRLKLVCSLTTVTLGNKTKCEARLDGPATPFIVQSWSYAGTATPAAPAGDVKTWTLKPGETGTRVVTVTAQVGTTQQSATAELTVKDPCVYGDSILDSPAVQDGMRELWQKSNYSPTTPQEDRREQYAWVVQTPDGYDLVETTIPPLPCGPEQDVEVFKPANAVKLMHTHPWHISEPQPTCRTAAEKAANATPVNYTGLPSSYDTDAAATLGVGGYIVDANGVMPFDGSTWTTRKNRCGY